MAEQLKATVRKPPDDTTVVVQRAPLIYAPWSTAAVNKERLPATEKLGDMELAYRQQYFDDDELRGAGGSYLYKVFLASMGFAILSIVSAPFIPIGIGFALSILLSLVLSAAHIFRRSATAKTIIPILLILAHLIIEVLKELLACPHHGLVDLHAQIELELVECSFDLFVLAALLVDGGKPCAAKPS